MKPGPSLLVSAILFLVLGVISFFVSEAAIAFLCFGAALFLCAAADAFFLLFFSGEFEVRREVKRTMPQGRREKVTLIVKMKGASSFPRKVSVYDLYPPSMETDDEKFFPYKLDCARYEKIDYYLSPCERGSWYFRGTEIMLSSPLNFWRYKKRYRVESAGRTYPDFSRIKAASHKELRGASERAGVKNIRRRGNGLEFRHLRDFTEGDALRDVDWRATARRSSSSGDAWKLTVKEYRDEQDQQILFLLDSGYRLNMREAGGKKQFDSALEAVLLLSWVSLRAGDSVAVGVFGGVERWLPPRKGSGAFPSLMNGLFDAQGSSAPSSPQAALESALLKLKRRTFIIMVSNFREEDGEPLARVIQSARRKHLLLLVSLREKESEGLAARTPLDFEEALETAAAYSYLSAREALCRRWEREGLLTLDVLPDSLSSGLINRYLEVKKSGRL